MLQNELNSDFARFTTHIKPVLQQITFANKFERWWQDAQHRFSTCSATKLHAFVARFTGA